MDYIFYLVLFLPVLIYFFIIDVKSKGKIKALLLAPIILYLLAIGFLYGVLPYSAWWFAAIILVLLYFQKIGGADKIILGLSTLVIPSFIIFCTFGFALLLMLLDKNHKLGGYIKNPDMEKKYKIFAPYLLAGFLIFAALSLAWYFTYTPSGVALIPTGCFGNPIIVNSINASLNNLTENTIIQYRNYCYSIYHVTINQSNTVT